MIWLDRYQPWHYEYLAHENGSENLMGNETVKLFANMYDTRGPSFTIKSDRDIIGCAGVVELWKGVAEAWTILSTAAKKAPFFLHRKTKEILQGIIEEKGYHRVQAIVNLSDEAAIQWIYALGFQFEGRMKRFNSDRTDSGMFTYPTE